MALTVSRERVKARCGIADTAYDAAIDALIAEIVPVVEYALDPGAAGSTVAGLVATLALGATEVVCAEFLAQLAREPGATEGISLNGIVLGDRPLGEDAARLRAQGAMRLAPYLRPGLTVVAVGAKGGTL